jgi:hypothetical protein
VTKRAGTLTIDFELLGLLLFIALLAEAAEEILFEDL